MDCPIVSFDPSCEGRAAIDRYTPLAAGAGLVLGAAQFGGAGVAAAALVVQLAQDRFAKALPGFLRPRQPESTPNALCDVIATLVGWWVGKQLISR